MDRPRFHDTNGAELIPLDDEDDDEDRGADGCLGFLVIFAVCVPFWTAMGVIFL